jgi:hypothetical protein
MASNDDLARKVSDLDGMLERTLFGQAELMLRLQRPNSTERPSLNDILAEYERLRTDYYNRHSEQPESDGPRMWSL